MKTLWLYLIFISKSLCSFPEAGYFITDVYEMSNCMGSVDIKNTMYIPATSSCISGSTSSFKLKSFDGKYLYITSYDDSTTCIVKDKPSRDVSSLCNSECDDGRRCRYKALPKKGSWKINNYLDNKCKIKSAFIPQDVTLNSTDTCQKTDGVSTIQAIDWETYNIQKNGERSTINALIVKNFENNLLCSYSLDSMQSLQILYCNGDCFDNKNDNFFYTCKYDSSSKIKLNLLAMLIIVVIVFS